MPRFVLRFPLLVAATGALVAGCGAGGAGEAVRPKDPTYQGVVEGEGESGAACTAIGEEGSPLVVDWRPEQRGDLEEAMSHGVAVVHYDCQKLELLPDCTLEGGYAYLGTTTEEQVISLANADEARANLPLNGAALGAALARGSTLDIGLLMIGKRTTTALQVKRGQLVGRCEGATHFVRAATLGAFAMKTGTLGQVSAAADVLGFGASAASSSNKATTHRSGDVAACKQADLDSKKPPQQCGAPIRIRLLAIHDDAQATKAIADDRKAVKPAETRSSDLVCPAGMVPEQGKCAAAKATRAAHTCTVGDAADCETQCKAGDAASCLALGFMYSNGSGAIRANKARAAALYNQACEGGQAAACTNLGMQYLQGEGVASSDDKAAALFARACNAGNAEGCYYLGDCYEMGDGVAKNEQKSIALYERACDAGYAPACSDLGTAYEGGFGVPQSWPFAMSLYQRACDGGDYVTCGYLGILYKGGEKGVKQDKTKAVSLLQRACSAGHARSCRSIAASYTKGDVLPVDATKALAFYKTGCSLGDTDSCKKVRK